MTDRSSIKVVNGSLQETPQGEIILRGVLDPHSLQLLEVDEYQREILSPRKVKELQAAIRKHGVPDIELGMRGERFLERDGAFYLQDTVFIVDGLQRTTAGLEIIKEPDDFLPFLGCKVHFSTTEDSEREMFEDQNLGQTKLSPNVTLRNKGRTVPAAAALFKLSTNRSFVLSDQISWNQNMKRRDMLTAATFVKVTGMLHSHAGPGRTSNVVDLINGVQKIMDNVGQAAMVTNVRTFFDIVDQCWGIRRVTYKSGASFLKAGFLLTLARVFSDHTNFWKEDKLFLDRTLVAKLASFPIDDPEVTRLASSGGPGLNILYILIVDHINSGKRTKRLTPRRALQDTVVEDVVEDAEAEGES
jgi:hypothetical protein